MKIDHKGFIALFVVLIISAILLVAASTISFTNFYGRFNVLESEFKLMSNKLVDACLERARLSIALEEYIEDEVVTVNLDDESCDYVILNGGNFIESASLIHNVCTYYFVEVDSQIDGIPIQFFEERAESGELETCD
jgi:hypothetical protein